LCAVNRLEPSPQELIDMAYEAEKNYVGVSIGKLDPACEVLGQKGHLLYLDTSDDSYELIPDHPAMKPFSIMVFFSGLEHSNAGSRYNMRVDELRSGVYALMAFAGMAYGKFSEANARFVPREVYEAYKSRLPEPWAKRCEHWYTEYARVEAGAQAWRRGDLEEFGRLCFESGRSSIVNWESGAPEQIRLYEIMRGTKGIYGGRFCGAGFKGCCLALTEPGREGEIRERVTRLYLTAFPHLTANYAVFVCHPADGVGGLAQ
jgi:galactokinase/galacturonokinase